MCILPWICTLFTAYEDFVKDTNASIEEKSKDIVNKSESKAKAEADLVEAKENKEAVMLELEQLANYKAELHSSCDFVMKNFEIRQTARDEEIEAFYGERGGMRTTTVRMTTFLAFSLYLFNLLG